MINLQYKFDKNQARTVHSIFHKINISKGHNTFEKS